MADNKEEKKTTNTKQSTKKAENKKNTKKDTSKTNGKKNQNNVKKDKATTTKKATTKSTSTTKNNSKKTSKGTSIKPKKESNNKQTKAKNIKKQVKKDEEKVNTILNEQLKNMEKVKASDKNEPNKAKQKTSKTKTNKLKYDPEKIAEKIENIKKMPKEEKQKSYKDIMINLIIACSIIIYFTFLYLGYINIDSQSFIIDLKVFSIFLVGISIVLFEVAYNKDSGKIAVFGIEVLINAIITLMLVYVYMIYKEIYSTVIVIVSVSFTIYYIIKSLIIYFKRKKDYKKTISDVKDIIEYDELEN